MFHFDALRIRAFRMKASPFTDSLHVVRPQKHRTTTHTAPQQKGRGIWKTWSELIDSTQANRLPAKKLENVLIPTMDTARSSYLLDLCISNKVLVRYTALCRPSLSLRSSSVFPPPETPSLVSYVRRIVFLHAPFIPSPFVRL